MNKVGNWAKFWVATIRAPFFIAVITPAILGSAIAWSTTAQPFHWGYFFLVLLGAILINSGTNLVNDYFDRATDDINVEYVAPFTGGSRVIQQELLTPSQVLSVGILCFTAAAAIGGYLVWATWASGPMVLILGAIGVFSGYFYTAPPFKLGYRWPAEAIVGLNCGILVTLGAYWVQVQQFSWVPVIASIPLALLIAAVLWVNEIPDYVADKSASKNHIVVLVGKKWAARSYLVVVSAAYLYIALMVTGVDIPLLALLGLLAFPLALRAMRITIKNYADSKALAPANAMTPMIYLATGLLMASGFIIDKIV